MSQRDANGLYIPIAVIVLVACVGVSIFAGNSGNTGLQTVAMVLGGVIAVALVAHKVVSMRNR